jgi:hypothetical protein
MLRFSAQPAACGRLPCCLAPAVVCAGRGLGRFFGGTTGTNGRFPRGNRFANRQDGQPNMGPGVRGMVKKELYVSGGHRSSEGMIEATVLQAVKRLNLIGKAATFDFALQVGKCVVETVYLGDLKRYRRRDRNQERTLRSIATHPDLAMSSVALYRSVAIYELCERLGITSWEHVSTSHLRLVLPLKSDDQARLLQEAERNRWPVQRLDEEVAALMKTDRPHRNRGGRRRSSSLRQAIRVVDRSLEQVMRVLDSSEDLAADASPESARAAVASLRRAVDMCTRLQNRLERTLPRATSDPPSPAESSASIALATSRDPK